MMHFLIHDVVDFLYVVSVVEAILVPYGEDQKKNHVSICSMPMMQWFTMNCQTRGYRTVYIT
jgi:hypothetical protein